MQDTKSMAGDYEKLQYGFWEGIGRLRRKRKDCVLDRDGPSAIFKEETCRLERT